jgi:putative DNA primase/helicase
MVEQITISTQDQAKLHLAILGERQLYHTTAKNYQTKQIKNEFLKPEEVIPVLTNWNNNGFTTWLSINDKQEDKIEGVTALQDFWLDIDSRPRAVDDRPATTEEMKEALQRTIKIKNHIENEYAAIGFTASSGNGFHIHFPLPRFEIPAEMRSQVNKKVRAFAKKTAKIANVKIDNTYDISRRTTLIGTSNRKLENPIPTFWNKGYLENGLDSALKLVDHARTQNKALLDSIISTEEIQQIEQTLAAPKEKHIDIEQLCQTNHKVYDLYKVANKENEEYKKYGYPSRSEAEAALITILVMEGFSDQEINNLMQNCSLGKWQEKENSYRILTIEHARQQASKYIKERESQNQLILDIGASNTTHQKEEVAIADINPVLIAKKIVEKYSFVVEKETGILWMYDEKQGIYTEDSEETIKCEIVRLLDNYSKARFYVDIDFWIRYSAPRVKMNPHPELIGVANGVLNVKTKERKDYKDCKDLYVTVKIPVKFNPEAKCQKIEEFLNQILDESQRKLSQEFIGYCLLLDHRFKKAYIATGPTDTGKTVHQNLNTALLGEENVTNQTIQSINHNRFSPSNLFNKMANYCDDMPASIVKVTGNFKMATGNGRLSAERKGKDAFEFHNHAKFWLNCNQLPPVQKSEDCDAYYNRLIIVDYNHKIQLKDQNPNLINEITTPEELSSYLNYALDGLARLLKNKAFSETMSKEDVRAIYIKRTDSAKYFVENYVEVTDEYTDFIFHENLFHSAIKVCHRENIQPMNKGQLNMAMQQYCTGAQASRIRVDPKDKSLQPAWRYVKLKITEENKDGQSKLSIDNSKSVQNVQFVQTPSNSKEFFENKEGSSTSKENSKNQKEFEDPCTNSTKCTTITTDLSNTQALTPYYKQLEKSLHFHRLPPNEPHQCDGYNCVLLAEFTVDGGNFWCKNHFDKVNKDCSENGFRLVEDLPDFPEGEV